MDAKKFENSNSIAVVTGASGGIGLAIVKKLLEKNYIVYGTYYKNNMSNIVNDINSNAQHKLTMEKLDIRIKSDVEAFLTNIYKRHGRLDALVNNAGIASGGLSLMIKDESIEEVFKINFFSQIICMRAAYKMLRKSNNPSIVNIASISAFRDDIGTLAYSSSKAALIQATRIFAREYATKNIKVNAVAPGPTKTQMLELMANESLNIQLSSSSMKRVADPTEIANVVEFLLSTKSSYMTGQCIKVDGGQLC